MSQDHEVKTADPVNHPPHYAGSGIECIEAIEAIGIGPDFCRGNAIKYLWRLGKKGDALQDAMKAHWYTERLIQQLKESSGKQPDGEVVLSPTWIVIQTIHRGYAVVWSDRGGDEGYIAEGEYDNRADANDRAAVLNRARQSPSDRDKRFFYVLAKREPVQQ